MSLGDNLFKLAPIKKKYFCHYDRYASEENLYLVGNWNLLEAFWPISIRIACVSGFCEINGPKTFSFEIAQ